MISISNLAKSFGEQTLFEGATVRFAKGERYGIVGSNGSGKSTLLRILSDEEPASEGSISIPRRCRLGVLKQDHFEYEEVPILDVVMMGNAELWDAMVEKDRLLERADEHFDGDRYAELEEVVMRWDGYSLESRAAEILEGLGIDTEVHREPLSILSGGFKLRVLLAQTLAAAPDVLLLDEPTNHLDILSIRWLEKFLTDFKGVVVVVSHDHRFLDNVCTQILDIDYEALTAYPGAYSNFEQKKVEERARREAEIAQRQQEIDHHQKFVDRFRYKASKARQAQSRVKLINRMTIEPLPQSSRRYPLFRFDSRRPSGKRVLTLDDISKSYGDNQVLEDVSLEVGRGERVAVIGPNGIGKSTLLKIALGEVRADAGEVDWGYETHPGYFAQDHRQQLLDRDGAERKTVESWLWDCCPGEPIGFVRGQLGAVLFTKDEAIKRIGSLSGGEAARLLFCRHVVLKPNVLVLDEPTNHLDLEAIEALIEGLSSYEGTLLLVSHDRWFVSRLATRIIEISDQGVNDFLGSYDEYLERLGDDHLDRTAALQRARQEKREKREKKAAARA
ncbi:MAG: ABC-F family ATP-binding cassette domain-containing protein [Acidobacteriota bacterium]|nr:ABC-F family ATP-binding cassette domain-containing protein [Acidobacteriota bacterium]